MSDSNPSSAEFDDVRMRGFRSRLPVVDALRWIDEHAPQLDAEIIPLGQAAGRVLAEEVTSPLDVPAYRRAMMDGYAVQAHDTFGASGYNPLPLSVVDEVFPGRASSHQLVAGEAIRIMTGAPLPAGADAVIPAEKVSKDDSRILVRDEVSPDKHVGFVGEDIACGDLVLPAGRRLRPQDVGVLSSIGQAQVPVVRQPRVRLIITGDELCPAGRTPGLHQTVDANSPMLAALVRRDGGLVCFDGITSDQPARIAELMTDVQADVVIVSGGSSVGQEDHAPRLLAELGTLAIHGVAMRPSSPAGMGIIGETSVFLLPGNPVSCLCAYDFFAGRCIRQRAGHSVEWPYRKTAGVLTRKVSSVVGRQDYVRVRFHEGQVDPVAVGGASVLSSTSRADGFLVISTDSEGFAAGTSVEVFLYD